MSGKGKGRAHAQSYCSVFAWLEREDPEFARVIHELCLEGRLRGAITWLHPGAAARKEIAEKADLAPREATDQILAHIVAVALPDAAAWQAAPVGNAKLVRLEVESAEGGEVRLKGGAVLRRAEVAATEGRAPFAVWHVASGAPPTSGEAFAQPRRPRAVVGRGEGRAALAARAESDYEAALGENKHKTHNPYLGWTLTLLSHMQARHPEVYQRVKHVVDGCPEATFYLLVEPHAQDGGPRLVPDEVFNLPLGMYWVGTASEAYAKHAPPNAHHRADQNAARATVLSNGGGFAGMLAAAEAAYTARPGAYATGKARLSADERRYLIAVSFDEVAESGGDWGELKDALRHTLVPCEKRLVLCDGIGAANARELRVGAVCFVNSSAFLGGGGPTPPGESPPQAHDITRRRPYIHDAEGSKRIAAASNYTCSHAEITAAHAAV